MAKIFDSHAHYTSEQFNENRFELLNSLFAENVGAIMDCATDYKNSLEVIELCEKYSNMYCAVGIHPECVENATDEDFEKIKLLAENKKVKAVGECGLDYYWDTPKALQHKFFEKQLQFSTESGLPIIVHDRDAHGDTMDYLKKYKPRGVVHCFSGSAESAKEIVRLGMYIGFTGVLTFNNARKAIEAVQVIPLDRLLLETDCPYMAPVPFRGKLSHSGMIIHTAEKMAEIKGVTTEEILAVTYKNACDLFNIEG